MIPMARQMKDSGVEWIGEMPEAWEVVKCKHLATVQAGFPFDSAKFSNSEGTPLIRIRDITSGFTQTYYSGEYDSAYIVSKGDLLIGMDGDFNIRMWQSENALLNQRCCRVLSNSDIELSFLYYSLPFHLEITNNLAYATTVKHLSNSDVLNAPIPYPSKSIRGRIISFLNNKCAKIDKVVEQTRATIEEYKKLKQTIITEAVTKGVRGPRPMKPSGAEWIDDIPEEWLSHKLKYVSSIKSGDYVDAQKLSFDGMYPVYGGGEQISSYHSYNVNEETIIIGRVGARCGCVTLTKQKCWATDNALILATNMYTRFAYYLLTGANLNTLNTSNAQPLITGTKIMNLVISNPCKDEQQEIAAYLDTKCAEIDRIIEKKEQLLEELGSYKKSLIYEYVTGKKAVQA